MVDGKPPCCTLRDERNRMCAIVSRGRNKSRELDIFIDTRKQLVLEHKEIVTLFLTIHPN